MADPFLLIGSFYIFPEVRGFRCYFFTRKNISTDKDYFNHVYNPSFDTNGSLIYTAWTAWPAGGSRYSFSYFNYSLDGGLTWGSKDRYFGVTSAPYLTAGEGSKVTMAVSSSYLPFQNRIALYSSDDSGASWKTGVAVTSESSDHNPLLKIDSSGNINILLREEMNIFIHGLLTAESAGLNRCLLLTGSAVNIRRNLLIWGLVKMAIYTSFRSLRIQEYYILPEAIRSS